MQFRRAGTVLIADNLPLSPAGKPVRRLGHLKKEAFNNGIHADGIPNSPATKKKRVGTAGPGRRALGRGRPLGIRAFELQA